APVGEERPLLQFRFRHKRDQPLAVSKMRKIDPCPSVTFEEERHHIGVEHNGIHAAGSVLWRPRHSRRAFKKSSMDSSSGQKSPSRSCGSRGNLKPWAATSSSTAG